MLRKIYALIKVLDEYEEEDYSKEIVQMLNEIYLGMKVPEKDLDKVIKYLENKLLNRLKGDKR